MITAGLDSAWRRNSSALVIVEGNDTGDRFKVGLIREWRPGTAPLKPSVVLGEAVNACRNRKVEVLCCDYRDIDHVAEHLEETGIELRPFTVKEDEIYEAFAKFRWLLSEERVWIVDCLERERLLDQLLQVVAFPGERGAMRIKQPEIGGAHGDIVSALICAFHVQTLAGYDQPTEVFGYRRMLSNTEDPTRLHDRASDLELDDLDH